MMLLAAGSLLASGCVYKMSIQQGNYLVTDSVSQLKEGMTRSQVRFLLGTPMVPDAFNDDRWDYYYFFSSRHNKQPLKRRVRSRGLWFQTISNPVSPWPVEVRVPKPTGQSVAGSVARGTWRPRRSKPVRKRPPSPARSSDR